MSKLTEKQRDAIRDFIPDLEVAPPAEIRAGLLAALALLEERPSEPPAPTHAIHYVTSVSQPWRKILSAARKLAEHEAIDQLSVQPPRLSHLQEKDWADDILVAAKSGPVVVAAQSELALLRLLRLTKRQKRLRVYVLDGKPGCMELRLSDDGEFIDRWPEGFFDGRFEEVF